VSRMIDAYTWTTPNGQKLLIALEELGLPYNLKWVNIGKGEQKTPEYLKINPNNKIPAIVDSDGPTTVFESGAVLIYLADKAGKLIPSGGRERYEALEWLFFAGGSAPQFGQLGYHKLFAPEKEPKHIERFTKESERILGVLDKHLAAREYILASGYSVVDIMNFTWVHALRTKLETPVTQPSVVRWADAILQRSAVKKALALTPPAS
jgi:GST-like protein